MLGPILLSAHNLTYYHRLVKDARKAAREDRYSDFLEEKTAGWRNTAGDPSI
jgi:queuine tRNA-ribosyltransferase